MRILIELDDLMPPVGRVRHVQSLGEQDDSSAMPGEMAFTGWLGLLRALSLSMGTGFAGPGEPSRDGHA